MLVLAWPGVAIAGCTLIVDPSNRPNPSAATVSLSPEDPRAAETITATASGALDPLGMAMRYRFEWFNGESLERTAENAVVDSFAGEFTKGEVWRVRVTPLAEDDRAGAPTEASFTIVNTPPTLVSAALNTYVPLSDDRMRVALVGYEDADGDVSASMVRWRVGTRTPVETSALSFDLGALVPPVDPDTEMLTVEVVPSDGEDPSEEATVTIGPLRLENGLLTQWRTLTPDHTTLFLSGGLVAWDSGHRRFLFSREGSLWEYSTELGFAGLPDPGIFPSNFGAGPVLDDTVGSERILLPGWRLDGSFALYALHVAERGQERWQEVAVDEGGPTFRCLPSVYFDSVAKQLLLHGGWTDSCVAPANTTNDLWMLDLSDESLARWVPGSPFSSTVSSAGGSIVKNPVADHSVLVFGGFADESTGPVPAHRIDYPEGTGVSFTTLGHELDFADSGIRGPLAIPDPNEGTVVLGLGVDVFLNPVERVWTYTADAAGGAGSLRVQNTDLSLFENLDTTLGSASGVGGWHNGRIIFWPGVTSGFVSTFRVGEVSPPADENYLWRSVYRAGAHFATASTQAARDASLVVVTTSDVKGPAVIYDLDAHAWRFDLEPGSPPLERKLIQGGQTVDGALWVLGGRMLPTLYRDMQPYKHLGESWSAPMVTGSVPEPHAKHVVFDTGCGDELPMGFYGGQRESDALSSDATWLLDCPSAATDCTWSSVGGGTHGAFRDAAGAFDGDRYVVLHGGLDGNASAGFTYTDEVHYLDACNAPELGWQLATVLPDPVGGVPTLFQHIMVRTSETGVPPEFLIAGGQSVPASGHKLWRLREVAVGQYAWSRVLTANPAPAIENQPGIWDPEAARLIVFRNNGEVHELRLRD